VLAGAAVFAGMVIFGGPPGGDGADHAAGAGPSPAATKTRTGPAAAGGAGGSGAYGGYGVPTVTLDCPATAVAGARARCTQTAECWGGIVAIAGDARATRYDCREKHTWETFAIAVLPPDGETWNMDELERNPTVRKICSRTVLLGSRRGAGLRPPAGKWAISVLPPAKSAFDGGSRIYRCMATLGLDGLRGSSFRPMG